MNKVKFLSIQSFKSIKSLNKFEPRPLNVLIGQNGVGKTNFLDLFRALGYVANQRFQIFVSQQGGPDALLFGGRKRTKAIKAELDFGSTVYKFSLIPSGDRLIFDPEEICFSDSDLHASTYFLGNGHEESKLDGDFASSEDNYALYLRKTLADWRVYRFRDAGPDAAVRLKQAARDNLLLKEDAGNLASFLRYLRERHEEQYGQIVDAVRLAAPFFGDFVYRKDPDEYIDLEWSEAYNQRTVYGPQQLSDGALRFICLATLLLQPVELRPSVILVDEPELGLHPFAITLLAEMLQSASETRQVFISTQSVELVNQLKPEDVVIVDRKDGASMFQRLDGNALSDWLQDYELGDLWKMNILHTMFPK